MCTLFSSSIEVKQILSITEILQKRRLEHQWASTRSNNLERQGTTLAHEGYLQKGGEEAAENRQQSPCTGRSVEFLKGMNEPILSKLRFVDDPANQLVVLKHNNVLSTATPPVLLRHLASGRHRERRASVSDVVEHCGQDLKPRTHTLSGTISKWFPNKDQIRNTNCKTFLLRDIVTFDSV